MGKVNEKETILQVLLSKLNNFQTESNDANASSCYRLKIFYYT